MFLWLISFVFLVLISNVQLCKQYLTCETCAGSEESGISCRWCMETSDCVPSKYLCHPWKTVLNPVNCPVQILPNTFNDTFNRIEVAQYIHAANRVGDQVPVGAPMSCLMKVSENIHVKHELNVPTTLDERNIGVIIGVNHDLRQIFIGFRSTNDIYQLLAQFYVFMMGWLEDFALGGKMIAIYNQIYKDILNFGFDDALEKTVQEFPAYSLFVTGHSLGGAMATVFALHVGKKYPLKKVSLYSWSNPRVGDETFVRLMREHIFEHYRVTKDGDAIPDFPMRISQTIPAAHHNTFEVYYPRHMSPDSYVLCNQAETETCLKGSWRKTFDGHILMFGMNYLNAFLGYCE